MIDITSAEKKLRQAEFFLACLEHTSKEMVHELASLRGGNPQRLEFFFSACLSAAQSVYYVLDETGGRKFKDIQRAWRKGLANAEGSRFGRMIGLRDNDVHLGTTGAKPLPKLVVGDPQQSFVHYNAALFGPAPVTEMMNPDGKKVAGSVLRGTIGLYIDRDRARVEATTACREFIDQLRSLLDATKTLVV